PSSAPATSAREVGVGARCSHVPGGGGGGGGPFTSSPSSAGSTSVSDPPHASASANPSSTVDAKSRQAVRPSAGCRSARLRFRIDSSATRSASNLPYDTRTLRGPYSGRLWAVEGGGRGK